jgi:hypothetical protein
MPMERRRNYIIYLLFFLALIGNIGLWFHSHYLQSRWDNVPPVPSKAGARALGLGDSQFAYRATGIMLQNIGNTAAHYEPLKDYDYGKVGQWLFLADDLDPRSDFVPNLAAYYFSATQNPKQLPPIVDYLALAGSRDNGTGEKWRWLAQAVYLARWREGDMKRSLELAQELAAKYRPGRPLWIKQMPVFVMTAAGDKKSAYQLMLAILKEEEGHASAPEINSTIIFICQRILDKDEAAANKLCTSLPPGVK